MSVDPLELLRSGITPPGFTNVRLRTDAPTASGTQPAAAKLRAELAEGLRDALHAVATSIRHENSTQCPTASGEDELIPVTTAALAPFGLGRAKVIAALDSGQLTTPITSKQRRMAYKRELLEWQRAGGLPPKLAIKSKESNEFERRVQQGKLSRG